MAIDFPNAPTNGDSFTLGAKTWIYDSASASWKIYVNATPFLSTVSGGSVRGQVHFNPSTSIMPIKVTSFNNWGTTGVQFFNSTGDKQLDYWPDSTLKMTLPYNGVKFDITTGGSSSYADSVYRYRHSNSAYTPVNISAGTRLWEEYNYGYISSTYKTGSYHSTRLSTTDSTGYGLALPNNNHTAENPEAFIFTWGLKDVDWGLVQDLLILDAGGSLFINDPGGGYFPGWKRSKARLTIAGAESKWDMLSITASIAGKVLTVTSATGMGAKQITPGMRITVDNTSIIPDGCYISSVGTGTGGTGTYNLTTDCGTVTSRSITVALRPQYGPRLRFLDTGSTDQLAGSIEWSLPTTYTSAYISSYYANTNGMNMQFGVATTSTNGARTMLTIDKNGITVGGAAVVAAATTALASLRVPHGAAPSSPVDGDIWTTTAGMFVRINGVTKTVTLT